MVWLIKCPELVNLKLINTRVTDEGAKSHAYPKLETLKICGSMQWVQNGLKLFLQQSNQLKSLDVVPGRQKSVEALKGTLEAIDRIHDCIPASVERLTLAAWDSTHLSRFDTLKRLRIIGVDMELFDRLDNATLEHLEIICYGSIGKINANVISQLRKINTLSIGVELCRSVDLIEIIRSLHELSNLS